MAVDEALLDEFAGAPTLRLYGWRPAALSLGRFQRLSEVAHIHEEIVRVRRLTGGGAIHHREDEVTYSIVAPYAAFGGRGSPRKAYRIVHAAIAAGLEDLGLSLCGDATAAEAVERSVGPSSGRAPSLCYDRATDFDLKVGTRKFVGSAQRRKGAAFLQHGSIPLSRDPFSPEAVSLGELLGRIPPRAKVAAAVVAGFERSLGVALAPASLSEAELARARELEAARYSAVSWAAELP
jgi:lipoate-protein ligase A